MHDVDQLLKENEVSCDGSDPRTDEDAIETLLLEVGLNNCLSRFAKIRQAHLYVIAEMSQGVFCSFEAGQHLRCIHARVSGVVGVREIDECRLQADHQDTLLLGHIYLRGSLCLTAGKHRHDARGHRVHRRGISFSRPTWRRRNSALSLGHAWRRLAQQHGGNAVAPTLLGQHEEYRMKREPVAPALLLNTSRSLR